MSLNDNGISRKAYAGEACAVVEYFLPRIIIPKYFDSEMAGIMIIRVM